MAQSGGTGPGSRATGTAPHNESGSPRPAAGTGPQQARSWTGRSGRLGVAIVAGGTAIGTAGTILSGSEPGLLLGLLLVAATIIAGLVVATGAVYVIIPVPALVYTAGALLAGYVHDHRAVDASLTGLTVSAIQWIAGGFFAMLAATVIAILLAVGRWLFTGTGRRLAYRQPRSGAQRRYEPRRHDSK